MLFAELLSPVVGCHWHVGINRLSIPQCLLQNQLSGCGVEQVVTTQNVCHSLPLIIDHHSQLIGHQPIAAAQHKVTAVAHHILAEFALYPVIDAHRLVRHFVTYGAAARWR